MLYSTRIKQTIVNYNCHPSCFSLTPSFHALIRFLSVYAVIAGAFKEGASWAPNTTRKQKDKKAFIRSDGERIYSTALKMYDKAWEGRRDEVTGTKVAGQTRLFFYFCHSRGFLS